MNMNQIQQMMKQAQKMQSGVEKEKKIIEDKKYTESIGGVVTIDMMGTKEIVNIDIKEDVLNVSEKEELQDMIKMAVNNLHQKIDKEMDEKMGPLTQGLPF